MYLFLIVSETLYEKIPVLGDGSGPLEEYKIVCLVSAQTREQARWAAWQTDKSFDGDVTNMPNFRTRKLGVSNHSTRMIIKPQFDDETGRYTNEWGDIPDHVWLGT